MTRLLVYYIFSPLYWAPLTFPWYYYSYSSRCIAAECHHRYAAVTYLLSLRNFMCACSIFFYTLSCFPCDYHHSTWWWLEAYKKFLKLFSLLIAATASFVHSNIYITWLKTNKLWRSTACHLYCSDYTVFEKVTVVVRISFGPTALHTLLLLFVTAM